MAILDSIVIQDYRNIELGELTFSPNVNCISGSNGEGKTNLMDAIWCLSMTKSAISPLEKYNFRHGCSAYAISGSYTMPGGLHSRFALKVEDGGEKKLRRDDKPYTRISEHMGVLPIVMVSPADSSMVSESGEERRRFINSVLSQTSREYLSDIQQYNRLLAQRNKLLKENAPDAALFEVIDSRMGLFADRIHSARKEFVEALSPIVANYYSILSGGREQAAVAYSSDMDKAPLEELLRSSLERDRILKYTGAGPQRDDLVFTLDGHPIRRCGSQGQQKSFLVAIKFAQYELMKEKYGFPPMLLLDDVFDKLDMDRTKNLLSLVAGNAFGQIFISDSNKVRMSAIVDSITKDRAYFTAENGHFRKEGAGTEA